MENRNNSEGAAFATQSGSPGVEVGFFPPLQISITAPEQRYARLCRIAAQHVVPRLLALQEQAQGSAPHPIELPRTAEIAELAALILGPENEDAAEFILRLRDSGISLDSLHAELLEPAARHLGELWNDDKIDFVDVTLGVGRLQRLVHIFGSLDQVQDYDEKRKVLLACAPGEQHSLGSTIVQKFLRAAGWHVCTCATPSMEEAADFAQQEWFGVVGFSLSSDLHVEGLAKAITRLRRISLNRKVGVMVGGSAISRQPSLVQQVGADGTAANGPAAVLLAKKLLAIALA